MLVLYIACRSRLHLINATLSQTKPWHYPFAAVALHTLPCVLADVGFAPDVGTFQAAFRLALLQFWSHP